MQGIRQRDAVLVKISIDPGSGSRLRYAFMIIVQPEFVPPS